MATKWQRFSVNVPKSFNPNTRKALANDIVKHVRERSKSGKDINGKQFAIYSKTYATKKGVSRGAVDLILQDKMLRAMKQLSDAPGKILIGYKNGSKENAKADGNHRGTYGKQSPRPGKARKFVGISKKDLEVLVEKHKGIQKITKETVAGVS